MKIKEGEISMLFATICPHCKLEVGISGYGSIMDIKTLQRLSGEGILAVKNSLKESHCKLEHNVEKLAGEDL